MSRGPRWYEYLGLCAVFPVFFFGATALVYWLTDSDPLIQEIWRLRGQNSLLRERLAEWEGKVVSDTDRLRSDIATGGGE